MEAMMRAGGAFMPDFLPGRLTIEPGRAADYFELERFHYRPGRPRTWAAVWVARYLGAPSANPRLAAVGVLSWPVPTVRVRDRHFGMTGASYRDRIRFANAQLRTISRVVVHPQFRSLGLASMLVRQLCRISPTRYVEAMAVMGRAHPLFEKSGMKRLEPLPGDGPEQPVYYVFDKDLADHSSA